MLCSCAAGLDQLVPKLLLILVHAVALLQKQYFKGEQQHIFNFLVDTESESEV